MKKFFQFRIVLFFLLCSSLLFAFDDIHSQNEKTSTDSLITNTSAIKDSTNLTKKTAGLIPLKISSLFNEIIPTSIITKNALESTDYRTTADFFSNVPFGFVRDLGFVGQPNETVIYGQGFGNVSFLSDGLSINDRLSNSLDLNLFQSENIDSIEIIPINRGFLFSEMNNPVSVNFISSEPELRRPYSRIKYYQAPNNEGMIDGIFNITPFKRLNAYFEITNQSTNKNFANTDLSNWLGTIRLRYLLSNSINILATYKYVKTKVQLFGGIDADSINIAFPSSQFESILYDKFRAPVRFTNRYQKVTGQNFSLRMLGNFIENSHTDISVYYQNNLTEFRQNESGSILQNKTAVIFDDNENTTYGLRIHQDFNYDYLKLVSITNYERNTFNSPLLSQKTAKTSFSTLGLMSFSLINNTLTPSVYVKYLNYSNKNYFGFGGDASFVLDESTNLYFGFSSYEKPYSVWEERFALSNVILDKQKNKSFLFTADWRNSFSHATIGYFNHSTTNELIPALYKETPFSNDKIIYAASNNLSLQGLSLKLDFNFWKVLVSTNTNYYFNDENIHNYNLAKFSSFGGVYYVDSLFNNNLHLKAGFNYSSIGVRDFSVIDFEKNISSNIIYDPSNKTTSMISTAQISPSFQLDFFLAGKIQKSATIYFVFENLFNAKYFIIPYYPKQAGGIRFGFAWEFLD